ncbi:MAG: aminoacyl-tRNA hydrolase [Lachnospiraceae bacterium]|jgi:PTH1 family peptidyl-tRNA hydrolase|nr:aminoacyl-tRNA hydrolase [Lachnospiraceae bacterium]MBR3574306.1 aminoacyl-tRNA hydrolase [Lachnospiraceae bacterium]MCR5738336.1 aminoacyl-tRNA hydrolase [Lachnospiraceae bacterium]
MKMIVGLGNPGREYEHTRHNVGFDVISALAEKLEISAGMWKAEHRAHTARGMIGGEKVILVKPQTFMNLSGEAVRELNDYYKLGGVSDIIVISDDVAIPTGNIRIRMKGSSGGHNGLKNIILHMGSEDFVRVRVGVGDSGGDMVGHVLGHFSSEDAKKMSDAYKKAADAVCCIVTDGADVAMNRFNTRKDENQQ